MGRTARPARYSVPLSGRAAGLATSPTVFVDNPDPGDTSGSFGTAGAGCASGICEDGVCCTVACGPCASCDPSGTACTVAPPDDDACGIIDCDGLDTACRDYSDLTAECCEGLGDCQDANTTADCILFTDLTGPCEDGDACTGPDSCAAGSCTTGAPVTCDDGNPCTDDACDPSTGCVATPNASPCDDGDLCTTGDACAGGACAGTPVDCSALAGSCSTGVCDPASGACEAAPMPAGTLCDDSNACTEGEVCDGAGSCGGGTNACTDSGVAATDSGIPTTDSGASGTDSATTATDAAPPPPAFFVRGGGCSCTLGRRGPGSAGAAYVFVGMLLLWILRRRSQPRSCG